MKTHEAFSTELLVPGCNLCDTTRLNLFNNHLLQSLILKEFDFPKVFTNFENQIGKYSSTYLKADRDWTIVKKVIRNPKNVSLIVRSDDGFYDIIEKKAGEIFSEYGCKIVHKKNKNRKIKKGELLYRSTAYDNDLNFSYGRNLKVLYNSYKNLTYEDAIVCSESAAKKLSAYSIKKVEISLNNNDVLLNIHNDSPFPSIGEQTNGILAVRRRLEHNSLLVDFSDKALKEINYNKDTIFYADGEIIDIEIFSNSENNIFNQKIKNILKKQDDYNHKMTNLDIDENNCSDDLKYAIKRAKDSLELKWVKNGNQFDNIIIVFTIMYENKLAPGCKITNRYGGKGVVNIIPDSEMPTTEDGEIAELVINPLGVINRENISQLVEMEINFISNRIVEKMKEIMLDAFKNDIDHTLTLKRLYDLFFSFFKIINKNQHDFLLKEYNNYEENKKLNFFKLIIEDGIYVHQSPFYNNINFDTLLKIYKKFKWIKPYKFKNVEEHLIMGEVYYMRLKHDGKSKFSARSSGFQNLKNIPSKTKTFKNFQFPYSKTPIRWGEMENLNLMCLKDMNNLIQFMNLYSSNTEARQEVIKKLLTKNNPFNINVESNSKNNISRMIDELLKGLNLKIK